MKFENKNIIGINKRLGFSYMGETFNFIFTFDDFEIVEKYETAENALNKALEEAGKHTDIKARIINICEACSIYIDALLGGNTCNRLFGANAKYTDIIKLKNTLIEYVARVAKEESTATETSKIYN